MNKIVNGVAILLMSASLGACNKHEPAANTDAAADANVVVMPDENAPMPADANATDNAAMNGDNAADNAAENVTEQGSTDH
jgi:hypothetical protein